MAFLSAIGRHVPGAILTCALLLSSEGQCRADTTISPSPEFAEIIEKVATNTANRLRRAIAIGPVVGAAGLGAQPGGADASLSFGLGVYLFSIPTILDPISLIKDQAKEKLKEEVKRQIATGKTPTQEEIDAMARRIFEDVKAEVLGEHPWQPRVVEEPSAGLVLEANRLLREGSWEVRFTPTIGLKKISLGPAFVGYLGDHKTLKIGPEVSVRLLPGEGPRSPVIEIFARADFPIFRRDEVSKDYGGGVRLLLDVL